MSFNNLWMLLAAGFIVAAVIWVIAHYSHHFSRDANLGRRRRRNNFPIQPKVRRPMIKLSFLTKKSKKK